MGRLHGRELMDGVQSRELPLPVVFAGCYLIAPGFPHLSAGMRETQQPGRSQCPRRSLGHSAEPCLPPSIPTPPERDWGIKSLRGTRGHFCCPPRPVTFLHLPPHEARSGRNTRTPKTAAATCPQLTVQTLSSKSTHLPSLSSSTRLYIRRYGCPSLIRGYTEA